MKTKIERSKELINVERRLFLRQGVSLGALSLLAGCNITDQESVQRILMSMSRWNAGLLRCRSAFLSISESCATRFFRSWTTNADMRLNASNFRASSNASVI